MPNNSDSKYIQIYPKRIMANIQHTLRRSTNNKSKSSNYFTSMEAECNALTYKQWGTTSQKTAANIIRAQAW